jgi:bifunctional DNase/RNase
LPGSKKRDKVVEVSITKLVLDESLQNPVVVLREIDGNRVIPIWIGHSEASAIAFALENIQPERPFTHDLLKSVLEGMEGEVKKVVINDLKNNTFFARIVIESDSKLISIDARPSDSIALALRVQAPIFVAEEVLEQGEVVDDEEDKGEEEGP